MDNYNTITFFAHTLVNKYEGYLAMKLGYGVPSFVEALDGAPHALVAALVPAVPHQPAPNAELIQNITFK